MQSDEGSLLGTCMDYILSFDSETILLAFFFFTIERFEGNGKGVSCSFCKLVMTADLRQMWIRWQNEVSRWSRLLIYWDIALPVYVLRFKALQLLSGLHQPCGQAGFIFR